MENKRNVIISCGILVAALAVNAYICLNFLNALDGKTIYDFLIYSVLIPGIICLICGVIIGLINKKFSITAIYAIAVGVCISIELNLLMLSKIDNQVIEMLMQNTPDSESLTVTTSSSAGFSSILSSILVFAVFAAVGGGIGKIISKLFAKKN